MSKDHDKSRIYRHRPLHMSEGSPKVNRDEFFNIINPDIDASSTPTLGLCNCIDQDNLPKNILIGSDLDGFEDTRVSTLAYYTGMWYTHKNADNIDRCHLNDIYTWLTTHKPTLEIVSQDMRCHYIRYYLVTYGAVAGDYMGAADLQDILIELDSYAKDKL